MTAKETVRIRLFSDNDGQRSEQTMKGDLYLKNGRIYVRYEETSPEVGRIATTVNIGRDRIKLIRHGALASEQTFVPGEWTTGYMDTPYGRMELRTRTQSLLFRMDEQGLGATEWTYELLVQDQPAGNFKLRMKVEQ